MLAEAAGIKKIVIACGRTDLRKSIDGLAQLIGTRYDLCEWHNKNTHFWRRKFPTLLCLIQG